MEIIRSKDSRHKIYEELIIRRDSLKKEASACLALYINRFGELITAVFRKKIDCISRKKAISFCTVYVNHGQPVNFTALQEYIRSSTEEYRRQLAEMIEDNETFRELKTVPEAVAMQVKQIYRKIAKVMHPDINPATDNDPVFLELWQRIDIAYRCNDLEEMERLELLVSKALEQAGCSTITIDIPDIEEKIAELRNDIDEIRSTDPYMYKFLLDDEEACREKEYELKAELAEYEKYDEDLKRILREYVRNGVEIEWEMN